MTALLPKTINRVIVPPIKCQGIKTKLVPFIAANIAWDGDGRWIEPFAGSGVVSFNIQPQRAVINDINPYIIDLYRQIYHGKLTPGQVRSFLEVEGTKLATQGGEYYYKVRERFNETGTALDFLFLNRSCFNGMIRFNQQGGFNVPFCRKPDRFRPAYVTKIVNQVAAIRDVMAGKEWEFRVGDWRDCLQDATPNDFVYLDPPYVGRHTDYYTNWSDDEAVALAEAARSLSGGYALSMWKQNKYRANDHLPEHWDHAIERTMTHFYHLGATEDLRNAMIEALMIKPGFAAPSPIENEETPTPEQLSLPFGD